MDIKHQIARVNGIRIHYVTAGQGSPLVLLHGFPQSWYMWRKVIPPLAERFTVIAPDLRGYGDSDKPRTGFDKKTMASDINQLLRSLGHQRFALVGHDRGARVSYRYAFEHPDTLSHLVVMDIVPTGEVFDGANAEVARRNWHWFFFQLPDLPERFINADIGGFMQWMFRNGAFNPAAIEPEAVEEYRRAFSLPGSVRSALEDYRAGATVDTEQDRADKAAGRKLAMPVLALWGADGGLPGLWPVMEIWQRWASNAQGEAIPQCGHYLPEEQPEIVVEKLLAFLK